MIPAAAVWVLVLIYPGFDVSLHFASESSCNAFLTKYTTDQYAINGCNNDGGGTCGFCIEAKNLATDKRAE
jgi:hypothetical protein